MADKVRTNIVLTRANYERLKELVERVPGTTMSGYVNELLDESLPVVLGMLDKSDELPTFKDDAEAQEDYITHAIARQMVERMFGTQEDFIHTLMKLGGALGKGEEDKK
jgi:hypothetical protein